jgi:hypothetical protein
MSINFGVQHNFRTLCERLHPMRVLRGRTGILLLSRRCANLFRAGGITKERVSQTAKLVVKCEACKTNTIACARKLLFFAETI